MVVGGRPAGASLAARLGATGLRVLVLDRCRFPSRPAVSAPFLLPHALALLDELGLDEEVYAADTPKLRRIILEFSTYFRAAFRFFEPIADRTHFYAIDRARLDHALWTNLDRFESVTAVQGAHVVDLIHDEGRVVGVRARLPGRKDPVALRARCVVGADGRYSVVARKAGAAVTHQRRDLDTTLYYAHWEGVCRYDDDPRAAAQIHTSCDGFSFVFMPTADEQVMVVAQGQAARYAAQDGPPLEVYESLLRARPHVWWRLERARRVSKLAGIRQMGNLFRQPHGPGWALVGDAYHHKDSIDAQGIYDALLGARRLSEALVAWHTGEQTWDEALARYAAAIEADMRPMFDATMDRVKRELYEIPPPLAAKTLMRWVLTHEGYGRRFASVLTRRIDPREFFVAPMLIGSALGGGWNRLRARLLASPDPSDPLTLPRARETAT